jgi:LysR family transcriptional regulator, hydrogen peroxide-inducible genes activator
VNLRDLKYFVTLADERHFGRAAERAYCSQPTLSGQIRKLEREIGVTLFERTPRAVLLTTQGAVLLPLARRAVEQADAMVQLARSGRDPLAGDLRIGVIPTVGPYLLPAVLGDLKRRFPQMQVALLEDLTQHLLQRLDRNEIDCVLIATSEAAENRVMRPIADDPFLLALPSDHPMLRQEQIRQEQLEELPLLLLDEGHCLADQTLSACHRRRNDLLGVADVRAASLDTLVQLVAAGLGVTLVPTLAQRSVLAAGGIVLRPVSGTNSSRRITLVWRKSFPRPAAIEAFASVILSRLPAGLRPLGDVHGAEAAILQA